MIRVGVLKIDFHVSGSKSLKEKRFALRRIKDRVKSRFNVSIAEIDNHDKWQAATLGASCVSNDKKHIDSVLNKVKNFIERDKDIVIVDYQIEII